MSVHQKDDKFGRLREQAEELIRQGQANFAPESAENMRELIQELKVHQAELEIQNQELRRAQQENAQLQQEYQDLYEFAPFGYLTLSPKGIITRANLTAVSLLGRDRNVLLRSSFTEFIVPDWVQAYHSARQKAIESGEKQNVELQLQAGTQGPMWVLADIDVVKDDQDRLFRFRMDLVDITERKRLEQSLRREHDISQRYLNTTQTMMVALDTEGRITMINRAGRELLGYTEDELLGCHWFETCLAQPEGMNRVYPVFQRIMTGDLTSVEYFENSVVCRDGTQRLIGWHNAFMKDDEGRVVGILSSGEDITERKHAEEALRESEERFKRMVNEAPLGIAIVDSLNEKFYLVNPALARITGRSTEELERIDWVRITHPDDIQPDKENMAAMNAGKIPGFQMEKRYLHADGQYFWVNIRVSPMHVEDKSKPRHLLMVEDINERKLAEAGLRESQKRLADIIDFLPDATLAIDHEKRVIIWNKAIQEMTGISAAEMIGKGDHAYTIPFYGEARPQLMDLVFLGDEEIAAQYPHLTREGESFTAEVFCNTLYDYKGAWVFAKASPLRDQSGNIIGAIESIRDITERKRAEEALHQAKEQAETANQAKSQFLANMSHEIRTPLNGIMGMHQLLQTTDLDEEQNEYLEMAHNASQRLNRLLSDILDLSRIESGKIELKEEEFILKELKQSVEDIFRHTSQENNNALQITLDENVPERLVGDSTRLTQILFNLVGNALKYTRNGEVSLQASCLPGTSPEMRRLLFVVEDNGSGIPEDKIDQVFESFAQASDSDSPYTRQFEGAGLGLPLVKRLLRLMDGNACILSQEDKGTTFYVSLPFKVPEALQQNSEGLQEKTHSASTEAGHVLLVDDEQSTQFYIQRLLEKNGYRVTVAENGEEALAKLAQDQYDCVLMDVQMPVMDGVEAVSVEMAGDRRVIVGGSSWGSPIPEKLALPLGQNPKPFVVWLTHHDIRVPGYEEKGYIRPAALPGIDMVVNGHIHRRLDPVQKGDTLWITPGNISR
ncbi:MAG: PAS domain S-box protein, partial [Desulfovermiculus sp.]